MRRVIWPLHERMLARPTLRELHTLEASQWASMDDLYSLQNRKLRQLLIQADRLPFYHQRLLAAGLDTERAEVHDLARLPLLTKDEIRVHIDNMIDSAVRHRLTRATTGGSTGAPLTFYVDRARQAADQAARARSRRWFNIDIGDRELYLWGSPIEAGTQDRLKQIRDRITNQRLFSAFEMRPAVMSRYLREMQRFDPIHLFGYPSSIARLVRHARQSGQRFANPSLHAVFVTGELFDRADRTTIEEAVNCPVADGYGAREAGFIAHQCPHGSYHITMESLIVEIVNAMGQAVPPGQEGEIVITHLDALAMPFIRYRTGDLGRLSESTCPCGRTLPCLSDIRGRKTDRIRTVGGGEAHALSLIYVLREHPGVREFKIFQQADLSLDVLVVAAQDRLVPNALAQKLCARIGRDISVRIKQVEAIPPDPSGKHRCVVSHA